MRTLLFITRAVALATLAGPHFLHGDVVGGAALGWLAFGDLIIARWHRSGD